MKSLKHFTFWAILLAALALPILVQGDQRLTENKKIDAKILKIKNPLKTAKIHDWAKYNVLITSPMTPEPMKSRLELKVVAVGDTWVKVHFYTNLMGQVRKQVQKLPKNAPLIESLLILFKGQLRLRIKLEEAKLKSGKVKIEKKEVKCDLIDAKVSGMSPSGQQAKNTMKMWLTKEVAVFGLAKAAIETEWKLGDTKMNLKVSIELESHSKGKKAGSSKSK